MESILIDEDKKFNFYGEIALKMDLFWGCDCIVACCKLQYHAIFSAFS